MFIDDSTPMAACIQRPQVLSAAAAMDRIRFRPRSSPCDLDCWIFQPLHREVAAAPILAVHGIRRRAREQVELLADRARARGRVVIAPIFDAERWPRYQQAVIRGRADKALLRLWRDLRGEGIVQAEQCILSGFSGGAQFAHRFAMLYPHMIERLIVSSAGWYTFPDAAAFPYGLTPPPGRRAVDALQGNLRKFLQIPITVTIGERDNRRDHNTRAGNAIDAQQGCTRMDRASKWCRVLLEAADGLGIETCVSIVTLPRCGHSFRHCIRRGGLDDQILPWLPSTGQGRRRKPAPFTRIFEVAA